MFSLLFSQITAFGPVSPFELSYVRILSQMNANANDSMCKTFELILESILTLFSIFVVTLSALSVMFLMTLIIVNLKIIICALKTVLKDSNRFRGTWYRF